jgi:hypothetical protein
MFFKGKAHLVERLITVALFKLLRLVFCPIQQLIWKLNGTADKLRQAKDPLNYERSAQVLDIVMFHKFCELQNTVIEEFITTHNRFENPQYILDNDEITLMCINDESAVFVQAREKGLQLWHSSVTPFIRLSQMYHGKRLIVLPLASFHKLADSVGDPKKLIFFFNCARCGSTLMGQTLEFTDRCVVISEPDAPQIISVKYRKEGDTPELRRLAKSVIRMECRPFNSFQPPPDAYMVKLIATAAIGLPFLMKLFPEAKCLFMYRDPIKVSKSVYRLHYAWPSMCMAYMLGGLSGKLTASIVDSMGYDGKDYNIRLKHGLTLGVVVYAIAMRQYLDLRKQGIDVVAVRYEDVMARPRETVEKVFRHCNLPLEWVDKGMKGLDVDSQRNTPLSRDNIGGLYEPQLTPDAKKDLSAMLRGYGLPTLDEECLVEGTISYKKE